MFQTSGVTSSQPCLNQTKTTWTSTDPWAPYPFGAALVSEAGREPRGVYPTGKGFGTRMPYLKTPQSANSSENTQECKAEPKTPSSARVGNQLPPSLLQNCIFMRWGSAALDPSSSSSSSWHQELKMATGNGNPQVCQTKTLFTVLLLILLSSRGKKTQSSPIYSAELSTFGFC